MWTTKNRARYERKGLRYESDLTDEEYALIEPFLPPERNVSRRSPSIRHCEAAPSPRKDEPGAIRQSETPHEVCFPGAPVRR
jgi:hypothetical protein